MLMCTCPNSSELLDKKKWLIQLDDSNCITEEHCEHVSALLTKLTEVVRLRLQPEKATVQEQRFSMYLRHTQWNQTQHEHKGESSSGVQYPQPKSTQFIKVCYRNLIQNLRIQLMIRPLTELTSQLEKQQYFSGQRIVKRYFRKSRTIFQLHQYYSHQI